MKPMKRLFFLVACLVCTVATPTFAQEASTTIPSDKEKVLKIAFGTQLPPYVIRDAESFQFVKLPPYVIPQSGMGIEIDIVREALKEEGYSIEPIFLRQEKIKEELDENPVDGITPCNENAELKNMYFSNPHISYQNAVITKKSAKFKIESIADLKDKSIYAFQNAKIYLGDEFKNIVENNPNYLEITLRGRHMSTAMREEGVVIIMDSNIFHYYLASQIAIANVQNNFNICKVFPETVFKVAFKDKEVCDAFNRGLAKLKNDGRYNQILEKYETLMRKRVEEAEAITKKNTESSSWL